MVSSSQVPDEFLVSWDPLRQSALRNRRISTDFRNSNETSDSNSSSIKKPESKRLNSACDMCRHSRVKCSGENPSCQRCTSNHLSCNYSVSRRSGRVKASKPDQVIDGDSLPIIGLKKRKQRPNNSSFEIGSEEFLPGKKINNLMSSDITRESSLTPDIDGMVPNNEFFLDTDDLFNFDTISPMMNGFATNYLANADLNFLSTNSSLETTPAIPSPESYTEGGPSSLPPQDTSIFSNNSAPNNFESLAETTLNSQIPKRLNSATSCRCLSTQLFCVAELCNIEEDPLSITLDTILKMARENTKHTSEYLSCKICQKASANLIFPAITFQRLVKLFCRLVKNSNFFLHSTKLRVGDFELGEEEDIRHKKMLIFSALNHIGLTLDELGDKRARILIHSHATKDSQTRGIMGLSLAEIKQLCSIMLAETGAENLGWEKRVALGDFRSAPITVRSKPLRIFLYHLEVPFSTHLFVYFCHVHPFLDGNESRPPQDSYLGLDPIRTSISKNLTMAVPRASAKPIQSQLEAVVLKSALFGLALSSLPYVSGFLESTSHGAVSLLVPTARRVLKVLWAVAVVQHVNRILSHLSVNGRKATAWDSQREMVIVTGGSSGIGNSVARSFAEKGAKVFILDLNAPKESYGPNVFFYQTDVTSSSSIKKAAEDIRSTHGDPTVLINNAGVGFGETILEASEAHLRTVLGVNLLAHFLMVKEFLPAMIKKNRGHVVTVASIASFVTIAQNVDYSATKAAVVAFHEGLRQELDHRYDAPMVRTSIIHPSWVRTPLIAPLVTGSAAFPKDILTPEEVSNAIVSQILSGRGAQIILPPKISIISGIRGFPTWLQEKIRGGQHNVIFAGSS
ncbi:hypothetical protein G7Y89_g6745 [Cudoniella acicularis]|uniref:Short-chain dehydrogenase/reductase 3 n=1 Tax=Cudoniella acicularis TaxID=354080 RepID=A0A8H4RNB0_9HELO|nr:hypothetical protein G7Y89_g6745 [Cudoniella acicularis]